ncbi:MAG TPA: PspC domain-containing protein [Acidimicrobiales bacterium]|nr:PspC domain-containing protein [Acidimicrobiales bacterium]
MPTPPLRLSITRRPRSRMVAGVCSGIAAAFGVEAGVVRLAAVLLALCGGLGAVLYGVLWLSLRPSNQPVRPPRRGAAIDSVAILCAVAGVGLMARASGYWVGDRIALPTLVVAGAAALFGGRDESARGARTRGWPLRVALGLTLLAAGAAVSAAVAAGGWTTVSQSALGALAIVAGVAFLGWPWIGRLTADLKFEQRERIRSQERADVAAHLHDGVLQTLALIQRRADDPKEVRAMARRQERELREWLFEDPNKRQIDSVGTLLRRELAAVEDDHQVRVEVVSSGDAPLDDAGRALVAAGREAVVNAARHAKVDKIDVYMQADPDAVELFVRDRGVGFDPSTVDGDRHGVAESIKGRVERAGGTATVRTAPGEGTEIELRVPRPKTNGAVAQ